MSEPERDGPVPSMPSGMTESLDPLRELPEVCGPHLGGPDGAEQLPNLPPWADDFFSAATRRRLIRVARRIGASDLATATEAVDAAIADTLANAGRIDAPFPYARQAVCHHLIKERQRRGARRISDLAARGLWAGQQADDPDLAAIDDIDWVMHILGSLGKCQRVAMALYYDGLTPTEIAGELGITVTNATTTIHRARINLRNHEEIAHLHRRTVSGVRSANPAAVSGSSVPVPPPTSSRKE